MKRCGKGWDVYDFELMGLLIDGPDVSSDVQGGREIFFWWVNYVFNSPNEELCVTQGSGVEWHSLSSLPPFSQCGRGQVLNRTDPKAQENTRF